MDKPQLRRTCLYSQRSDLRKFGTLNDNNQKERQRKEQTSFWDGQEYEHEPQRFPTLNRRPEKEIQVRLPCGDEAKEVDEEVMKAWWVYK